MDGKLSTNEAASRARNPGNSFSIRRIAHGSEKLFPLRVRTRQTNKETIMETFKVWYGGDRGTVQHIMRQGMFVTHVNKNVIEVTCENPGKLRTVRKIFVLDAPRTTLEAALVEAASAKGFFRNA